VAAPELLAPCLAWYMLYDASWPPFFFPAARLLAWFVFSLAEFEILRLLSFFRRGLRVFLKAISPKPPIKFGGFYHSPPSLPPRHHASPRDGAASKLRAAPGCFSLFSMPARLGDGSTERPLVLPSFSPRLQAGLFLSWTFLRFFLHHISLAEVQDPFQKRTPLCSFGDELRSLGSTWSMGSPFPFFPHRVFMPFGSSPHASLTPSLSPLPTQTRLASTAFPDQE